jgi:radical SAM protein with 4Fe4S-binding SPASM domain
VSLRKLSKRRFSKVNIEISNICNLQCSFCPEVQRSKQIMDLPLFRRVIEQVGPLTDQVCLHLMGDPLVHPRLGDVVQVCSDHEVKIFLVTNGVLLRENHQALLLNSAFRQVCFSLHSFHDNFGDRDPTQYLEKIFHYTERALRERPDLYLNFRLWNLDSPLGSGEHNRSMLSRIEERFGVKFELSKLDVRKGKSIRIQGRLYLHFDTEFTWPALDLPVLGEHGTCYGLKSHFGILADGTVVPCCLDKEAAIPLGNIAEQDILPILESDRARAMVQGFRKNQLVEDLCKRCQYITRFG